ncbi:MAG: hypothetical protein ABS46_05795 [Cytophagaceae bacterium SCN 52-12]|nr:MAG: hypothetical protein ABS46_05795 [Cytophagaceae bacterium SCN 52-12]
MIAFQAYSFRKPLAFLLLLLTSFTVLKAGEWKAASARVVITPERPMWLAGYASRDRPSEGTLHDIWAKVLVLEDSLGKKAVLITADVVGIPKPTADRIRRQLAEKHGLSKAQVILNSSHTHSGPVLKDALYDYYAKPIGDAQLKLIGEYTDKIEKQIVAAVGEAIGRLKPAKISASNGVARFQVNRRNNTESALTPETQLNGPNDYAVPVMKISGLNGEPIAIVFGYACHPTVLSTYKWSGDYAGFAQIELERKFPGYMALFFQGAGADQNPLPRRTEALAEQYGITLAAAVAATINQEMKQLRPVLNAGYREVELKLAPVPTREELLKTESSAKDYSKTWARRLIDQIDRGESLMQSYPHYPVQIWNLGGLNWVVLGGEVVVEYALKAKEIFGNETFVLGYSNDMMAYIPSLRVLTEGGYEGARSQVYFKGLSSTWDPGIEAVILSELVKLADEMKVNKRYTRIPGN